MDYKDNSQNKTLIRKLSLLFVTAALITLISACEPEGWETYIFAEPEPVSSLTIQTHGDSEGDYYITVEFVYPESAVLDGWPEHGWTVSLYYREKGEPADSAQLGSNGEYGDLVYPFFAEDQGETEEAVFKISAVNGQEYVITAYVRDMELQLSE